MWSKFGFVGCLGAVAVLALVCASRGSAMLNFSDVSVVSETEQELVIKFTNASGEPLTVTFNRVTEDEHTYWKPVSHLQQSKGIAFGNTSPTLPNIVRLRDRGIDPATVVKDFSSAISTETFDDLTVYQSYNGEIGVALHNNGLVTRIYYAGLFVSYSTPSVHPTPPDWLCQRWKEGCCRTETVIDPDNPDGPVQEEPDPYIPACISAHDHCSATYKSPACDCLQDACQNGEDDNDFAACDVWWDCCGDGTPCDHSPSSVSALISAMGELLALTQM